MKRLSKIGNGIVGSEIIKISQQIKEISKTKSVANLTIGDFDSKKWPIPERLKFYIQDAYNEDFFIANFLYKNIKCDFMLDDGPHSLESMIQFIKLYSQIMTDDGILIIEDVQSWDWIDILKNEVPENLKQFIKIYDLRPNKNRYDDIVFTIDKSNM
jgi:hypothetical protein